MYREVSLSCLHFAQVNPPGGSACFGEKLSKAIKPIAPTRQLSRAEWVNFMGGRGAQRTYNPLGAFSSHIGEEEKTKKRCLKVPFLLSQQTIGSPSTGTHAKVANCSYAKHRPNENRNHVRVVEWFKQSIFSSGSPRNTLSKVRRSSFKLAKSLAAARQFADYVLSNETFND